MVRDDEDALTQAILDLATEYGRYGYRRISALLKTQGWHINAKRVQRIWRREGLKVPQKQPKRARLWLNEGSCIRLRAEHPNHVWSYDFVMDRTQDGRAFRMLTVIDEYSRQCLAINVARHLRSEDVLAVPSDLFLIHGVPEHIRSDNGSEFTAHVVRIHAGGWISAYAHSSIILVKRGDIVRRGQVIARVGRTGNVSKPQLHFELRRGERAVNPKKHLVRIAHWMPIPRQYADLSSAPHPMY